MGWLLFSGYLTIIKGALFGWGSSESGSVRTKSKWGLASEYDMSDERYDLAILVENMAMK